MSSPTPNWGGSSGPQPPNPAWSPTPDPAPAPAYPPPPAYTSPSPYPRAGGQQGADARKGTWRDGMAITALMCGIVALGLGWIGTGILGIIGGIGAVVFGILGLRSRRRARSMAGLVMGAIAIVGYAALLIVVVTVLASRLNS